MGDFVAAVEGVDLAGLEQGVEGFEGGLDAGQVGVKGDFVELGGTLDVPNAVEAEVGHGHGFGEEEFDFIDRVELGDKAGVGGENGFGVFGGEHHVGAEESVFQVVTDGTGLAFGSDGAVGFGTVGAGGGLLGFGGGRIGGHCDFIVKQGNGAGAGWGL